MFESSGDGAAGLEVEAPWWLDVPGFDDEVDVDALVAGADAVFAEGDEEHLALIADDGLDDVVMPEPLAELPVESMTADEALDAVIAVRGVQARLEARAMELLAHAAGPVASVRDVIVPDEVFGGPGRRCGWWTRSSTSWVRRCGCRRCPCIGRCSGHGC
jgi:hypothetical protein